MLLTVRVTLLSALAPLPGGVEEYPTITHNLTVDDSFFGTCPLRELVRGSGGDVDGKGPSLHDATTTTFFGYYFPSPWSPDGAPLVLTHVGRGLQLPRLGEELRRRGGRHEPFGDAGRDGAAPFYRPLELRVQHPGAPGDGLLLGRSSAWSFPLGARLMWAGPPKKTGGAGSRYTVVYNRRVGADDGEGAASRFDCHAADAQNLPDAEHPCYSTNVFRARLTTFDSGDVHRSASAGTVTAAPADARPDGLRPDKGRLQHEDLPLPVFAVSGDGKRVTGLNFARLYALTSLGIYGLPVPLRAVIWELRRRARVAADDGVWLADVQQNGAQAKPRLLVSAAQVLAFMEANKLQFADGRTAGQWLRDQGCFVWLEQPTFDSTATRVSFFARGKCPSGGAGEVPAVPDVVDKEDNAAAVEDGPETLAAAEYLTRLQSSRYFDIGVFTIGTDENPAGLWFAGADAPVSHFDFLDAKSLMLCGSAGMHIAPDRRTETPVTVYRTPPGTLPEPPAGAKHAKHDAYAGHCTFGRLDSGNTTGRSATGAQRTRAVVPPERFILTDTSCTACVLSCDAADLRGRTPDPALCPPGHAQARDIALLDREQNRLYRLLRLASNVSVPEALFVDLHPRFRPWGAARRLRLRGHQGHQGPRWVSFDSAHGDAAHGFLHARHFLLDVRGVVRAALAAGGARSV